MANVSISRRYARALHDVAGDPAAADAYAEQLQDLARLISEHKELQDVLTNPAYGRSQRMSVIEAVIGRMGQVDPQMANFLRLLTERNRLVFIEDIARIFRDMADASAGRVRGKVTSAVPLTRDQLSSIENSLASATNRNVVLETRIDPAILGGVSAQVGSLLFDGSLRTQLNALRETLGQR